MQHSARHIQLAAICTRHVSSNYIYTPYEVPLSSIRDSQTINVLKNEINLQSQENTKCKELPCPQGKAIADACHSICR